MAESQPNDIETKTVRQATLGARKLADAMPRLILEARRVASTVIHGLHGRRRAGPGENFWQYRRFVSGEPAQNVDWRRSARDDHLYVREQEWEAAHTVWLWPDRSPSMAFASKGVRDSKLERALIEMRSHSSDGQRVVDREQARSCTGDLLRAGRSAGAGR